MFWECCTESLGIVVASISIFSELQGAGNYEVNRKKSVRTDYGINYIML